MITILYLSDGYNLKLTTCPINLLIKNNKGGYTSYCGADWKDIEDAIKIQQEDYGCKDAFYCIVRELPDLTTIPEPQGSEIIELFCGSNHYNIISPDE